MPLVGVRAVYVVVCSFKEGVADGGNLAIQVVFGMLPEFLCMISYLTGGIMTCHLAHIRKVLSAEEEQRKGSASSTSGEYDGDSASSISGHLHKAASSSNSAEV